MDHVADLMLSGKWRGTKTHRELAAKWEISTGAVADYAREASSVIRRAVAGDGGEEIRAQILAGVEHVRRVAMGLKKPMLVAKDHYELVNTPDVKAALQSYEIHARILGLEAPTKVEVTEKPMSRRDLIKALRDELAILEAMPEEG